MPAVGAGPLPGLFLFRISSTGSLAGPLQLLQYRLKELHLSLHKLTHAIFFAKTKAFHSGANHQGEHLSYCLARYLACCFACPGATTIDFKESLN